MEQIPVTPVDGAPFVNSPPPPGGTPSPFDDFFGAGVGKPLEEHYDEMPEEISAILKEHSLDTVKYSCILKRFGDDGTKTNAVYVSSWSKKIPSMDYIARVYGPGRYAFSIQWTSSDKETGRKKKTFNEYIDFEISDDCAEIHEDYVIEQQIRRIEARKQKVDRARLKKELSTGMIGPSSAGDPREDAKSYVKEIAETAEMLGFKRNDSFPWKDILPLVIPLIGQFMNRGNGSDNLVAQMYAKMLDISKESSTNLLEVVKAQSGQGSGNMVMREMVDMVKQTINLREVLDGGKNESSAVDKLLELVQGVSPMIVALLAQKKEARENSVPYKMARSFTETSPEVAAIAQDPEALIEFVNRNDQLWGWRVTDMMLELGGKIGLARPPQCPRLPELELPQDQRSQPQPQENNHG
jgi:hypothetical protein